MHTAIQLTYTYEISVDVDEVVYSCSEWLLPRIHELLQLQNPSLSADLCTILHGLCEDVAESRRSIGEIPGIFKTLGTVMQKQSAYRSHVEVFKLTALLAKESRNVMALNAVSAMM